MKEGISQSRVKDLLSAGECHYKIGKTRREPTLPMQKGLLFEYELIGSTRDHEQAPAILTSKGKESVHHTRVVELAKKCKPYLSKLGFEGGEVQPSWKCEVDGVLWSGHPDWITDKGIVDVKYTEEAESRSAWLRDELDTSSRIQALHYTIMSKEIVGKYLPFYFLVFFAWGGVECIKVGITGEMIEEYKALVSRLVAEYDESKTAKSFNECVQCTVKDCPFRITQPTIRNTTISDLWIN